MGLRLFYAATSYTSLGYMIIKCKIQVIINPLIRRSPEMLWVAVWYTNGIQCISKANIRLFSLMRSCNQRVGCLQGEQTISTAAIKRREVCFKAHGEVQNLKRHQASQRSAIVNITLCRVGTVVPAVSRLPAAEAAEAQLAAADTLEPREEEELLDPSSIERLAILPANNKKKKIIFPKKKRVFDVF